jgi:hypothetical protein
MHQNWLGQLIKEFSGVLELLVTQRRLTMIRHRQMPHYKPRIPIPLQQAA